MGNTAACGGGINSESGFTANHRIIANHTGDDCFAFSIDGSHNLVEDVVSSCGLTNGVNGNVIGVDPMLGPLADNRGPTETIVLLPGSPAIDAGDPEGYPG